MDVKASLTYSQIQEGMVILSSIRHLTNFSIQIEFPGLTFGQIRITSISDPLNKFLSKHMDDMDANNVLKKMFQVGSFVPAKIMKMESNEKGYRVDASINPKDINADRRHNSFKKGMFMWACVEAELDHGYQLASGLKNCRIFLPSKNIDEGKTYEIGEPLWCVVHKCEESQDSSILRVSAKWEHVHKCKIEELDSLHNILPGMLVELFVDKVTKFGVEGKFLEDYNGYVDQAYLVNPLHTLNKVKEGTLKNARVLYIEPVTNITHLTLRSIEPVPEPKLSVGHVTTVEVMSKCPRGLYVKIDNEEKGFITNKRLLRTVPNKMESELSDIIRKKYPPGTKRQCRIIDYNHMEQMYICTFETDIVKQKVFSTNDLRVGQKVTVTIEEIKPDGVIVSAGHLRGFVANLHLTNTSFTENMKKKFTEGSQHCARVWNITEQGNVMFTFKQALIDSDVCLKNLENAQENRMYPGVVIQAKVSGVLVAFYGGLVGWVSIRQLIKDQGGYVDPQEFFYRGQVSFFRLLEIKNGRLKLSSKVAPSENKLAMKNVLNIKIEQNGQDVTTNEKSSKKKRKKTRSESESNKIAYKSEISKKKKRNNSVGESNAISVGDSVSEDVNKNIVTKVTKNGHNKGEIVGSGDSETSSKKKKKKRKDSSCGENNSVDEKKKTKRNNVTEDHEIVNEDDTKTNKVRINSQRVPLLPGIIDFFTSKVDQEENEESSSDEDISEQNVSKKKKKLTPAERAELARQEEERIRKIEQELVNSRTNPQTARHFESLVQGQPDSSELWLQYIAYHVSLMELDKARTVAKRALETIKMTMLDEKFNVWVAYLHLENMYGTKETFEKVFEDAVKYNDSMKIYLKAIEMLAESSKLSEMEEKVKKVKAKHKQNPEMWETLGLVYYRIKNFREARNCKDLALRSIQDKKTQLNLIVRFAIMEFKHGEDDQGSAVFETILQSDPRKVNIWITYTDQLVKKGSVDLARSVLDRAVCQKLPTKSMKTLFMKFRTFEEKYGTSESVQDVKRRAAEYVQSNCK